MSDSRSIIAITAIALTVWPAGPAIAESQDKTVIGRWQLTAVLDSAEVSALSDAESDQLFGKVLVIGAHRVQLGQRGCDTPSFEVTVAETDDYLYRNARAFNDYLGLPNPVTAVGLGCAFAFHKPPKLVIFWKGVLFDAVRVSR